MKNKTAIGILAFNVEKYIENVIKELSHLNIKMYVINDFSTDNTLSLLKKLQSQVDIVIINNDKNIGAGKSTKKLIQQTEHDGFDMLVKVDGDGQFTSQDIIKIVEVAKSGEYKYIKSNRFWEGGIKGNIPKKRFFGNLLATMFMQVTMGTNKLFDPLNGLFAVSTSITKELDKSYYPSRYGYPYFFAVCSVINGFKTYQLNNTVIYEDQKSNLKSLRVLFTILKLTVIFYIKKIKIKKHLGIFQRSAFLDMAFIGSTLLLLYIFFQLMYILFFAKVSIISTSNLLFLLIFCLVLNTVLFISSFKEEKMIRNTSITSEG